MSQPDGKLRPVLSFADLLVYGMTYMVPVAPWVIFGFLHATSGGVPALAYLLGMAGAAAREEVALNRGSREVADSL